MSIEKLAKTFHLKQVVITPKMPSDFKTLLFSAWNTLTDASDRAHKIATDSEHYRVLNDLIEMGIDKSVVSAPVFAFTLNANQNAVTIQKKVRSFDVSVLAPQRDSKKHQEFVEGLVYVAVKTNFIAIMANKAISFKTLEDYFSWLLTASTGKTVAVSFQDPPKPELKKYNMDDIKSVIFDGRVMTEEHRSQSGARMKVRTIGVAAQAIKDLIKALGANPIEFAPEKVGDFDNLEVSVVMRFIKRGNYHNASLAVQKIAETFRDLEPPPPVSFEFGDGRKLDVSSFRVSAVNSVPCENNIPVSYEVTKMLFQWLQKQVINIESQV